MTKQNGTMGWFRQNLWAIIIVVIGFIATYTAINTKNELRISAMEEKLAEYPSQDYFDLKFQQIDKDLSNLAVLVNQHIKDTK